MPQQPPETEALKRERASLKKLLADTNARYLEKIEELSLIRRVGDALKDITDFGAVCSSIVHIIQEVLDPDNCSLMIVSDETGELVLRAAKGPFDREVHFLQDTDTTTRLEIGRTIAGRVAQSGESVRIDDVHDDERFLPLPRSGVTVRSLLCIPLVSGERVIAVLNLSHATPGAFTADTERILSIIATSAAAALENTRLYERLRESRDRLARENSDLRQELIGRFAPENIIGTSSSFAAVLEKVRKVAAVDASVLITGESGTGKEVIAKALHFGSPRAQGPLVSLNCAALPEALLESELFGIEKGVATGVAPRPGKFELARGGTIFLDEIGDMALTTQARILRALQEREVTRVGGSTPIALDVRVIAATNRDLPAAIRAGTFREDLYYRLKVVEIALPPLRERPGDILLLANHFLRNACARHGLGEKWFSRTARAALQAAPWKGNVRELENVVEQAAILSAAEVITPEDLGIPAGSETEDIRVTIPENRLDYHDTIHEVTRQAEQALIGNALRQTGNNKSRAAQALGIGRRTLMYKLGS